MTKRKYESYDEFQLKHYKKHPKELKGYLTVALEEYQKDGDEKAFLSALSRENLYCALSSRSDPRLSTIMQVLGTLGFSLTIR